MTDTKIVGVAPETVRTLSMALPQATEKPHFDRTSFRVNNKIFVTLGPEDSRCVVKLPCADREALLSTHPELFLDVGWASQGWLGIVLTQVDEAMVKDLVINSWRNVAPKKMLKAFDDADS